MQIADVPEEYRPYLAISWHMVIYTLGAVAGSIYLLDTRLHAALRDLNSELAETGRIQGRQRWIVQFALFSLAVLLLYLAGGVMLLMLDAPLPWEVGVRGDLLLLALNALLLLALYIAIPHFLFCFNLLGRYLGPVLERPLALPAAIRTALSGPGVVGVCFLAMLSFVWFMQLQLPSSARLAGIALMAYAVVVSLLAHQGSRQALAPLFAYTATRSDSEASNEPVAVRPQSLDEIGAMTRAFADMLLREQQTIQQLREGERRFRMFAEASSDWFYEIDENLKFSYVSDKLQEILGIAPENVVGLPATAMSAVYEETDFNPHRDDLLARRPYRDYRFEVENPQGRKFHLQVSGLPFFDDQGRFLGYRGTGTDVTSLVEAQESLKAKTLELVQTQKMHAVGQLTGGLAHDFNNLLTIVLGNLELARDAVSAEDARLAPQINAAFEAAERGSTLVAQLMAFSRKQALRAESVEPARLIETIRPLLERTLGENIRIELVTPDEDACCWVDPAQLENALLNLAINARDAMPSGGLLQLKVASASRTERDPQDTAPYVLIEVTDTGTGIAPELLDMVFEPFFTTKAPGEGTGLGLSMVYGFVKQSRGDIDVTSSPTAGTRIRIWLPVADSVKVSPEAGAQSFGAGAVRGRGEYVLVVEDDTGVRELLERQLLQLGYRVESRPGPDAALEVLRSGSPIDVLLTDIVLAGELDGVEMTARALQLRPNLKTVFMTGYTNKYDEIGDRLLLRKPFSLSGLAGILRSALEA